MRLCAYIHDRCKEENKESIFKGGKGAEDQERDKENRGGRICEVVGRLLKESSEGGGIYGKINFLSLN